MEKNENYGPQINMRYINCLILNVKDMNGMVLNVNDAKCQWYEYFQSGNLQCNVETGFLIHETGLN